VLAGGSDGGGGEIEFAAAGEGVEPARGLGAELVGDGAVGAIEPVFDAAVEDALGTERLAGADVILFEEEGVVACGEEPAEGPETGDAAAGDEDLAREGRGHGVVGVGAVAG